MSNVLDVKLKSNVVTHLTGILRYLSIVLDFKLSIQCCNTPDILRYLYWYNRFFGHASYVPTGGHHQIPSLLTSVCNQKDCILQPDYSTSVCNQKDCIFQPDDSTSVCNCILQPDDQIINIQPGNGIKYTTYNTKLRFYLFSGDFGSTTGGKFGNSLLATPRL